MLAPQAPTLFHHVSRPSPCLCFRLPEWLTSVASDRNARFVGQLNELAASVKADPKDYRTWPIAIGRLRGHRDETKGIEWLFSREVYDRLDLDPRERRRSWTRRRVANGMKANGWKRQYVGPRSARESGFCRALGETPCRRRRAGVAAPPGGSGGIPHRLGNSGQPRDVRCAARPGFRCGAGVRPPYSLDNYYRRRMFDFTEVQVGGPTERKWAAPGFERRTPGPRPNSRYPPLVPGPCCYP